MYCIPVLLSLCLSRFFCFSDSLSPGLARILPSLFPSIVLLFLFFSLQLCMCTRAQLQIFSRMAASAKALSVCSVNGGLRIARFCVYARNVPCQGCRLGEGHVDSVYESSWTRPWFCETRRLQHISEQRLFRCLCSLVEVSGCLRDASRRLQVPLATLRNLLRTSR